MTTMLIGYNLATADERHLSAHAANEQIAHEIEALLGLGPAVLGMCEAIRHTLPHVPGYSLVRDTSRPGRANVAAYVRAGLPTEHVFWHDMAKTWAATEHNGTHPARSFLDLRFEHSDHVPDQVLVVHEPPVTRHGPHDSYPARDEMSKAVVKALKGGRVVDRHRTAAAIGDWNLEHAPLVAKVARPAQASAIGKQIDAAVTRGLPHATVHYVHTVKGVRLRSDHERAAVLTYG